MIAKKKKTAKLNAKTKKTKKAAAKAVKKPLVVQPKEAPVRKLKTPFSAKELSDFKDKLMNAREDIMAQIREISDETLMKSQKDLSGDMSGYGLHMADVATDNFERELNMGLVSDDREVALEIDEAMKRIQEKTYGCCEACSKAISKTRLTAIPYTRHCKVCQEAKEHEKT